MYVVFAEEIEAVADATGPVVQSLEQAFAQITCPCGYDYQFEPEESGRMLVLTDVDRPDCSPDPVHTDYMRPRDAKHDLIAQAVNERLNGHLGVSYEQFMKSCLRSA